jgi:3-oxoacyl-[acyl-carrier protein] reductase
MEIAQQVVWITGSASGVGLHLTDVFLSRGARVVATDIELDRLRRAARARDWPAERLLAKRLDVTDPVAWDAVYREVVARWERLDLLLNVAGVIRPVWLAEARPQDVHRHIDVNFKGVAFGSRTAARHMIEAGNGHIVNFASLAGIAAVPGIGLYSASKFAVRAYSLALAEELRPRGVAVTVLCPDAIETPMLFAQEGYEEAALTFSGGRTLTVTDIEDVLFDRVLTRRPVEVALPFTRGFLARLMGTFPSLSRHVTERLRARGQKIRRQRQRLGPNRR